MIQVAILIIVLLALALAVTAWEYWQLRKSVELHLRIMKRSVERIIKIETDNYMPCGKEKLSPVEAMLLLTEYMGVEFYGGDGGPCYVSTEHDEVMKKAHKEASRASFKG